MKKFSYLFLSLFAAMALVLSSCGDDEETDDAATPSPTTPTVTLSTNSTADGSTVKPGATLTFEFTASKLSKDLTTIVITSVNSKGDAQVVSGLTLSGFASDKTVAEGGTITLDGDDKNEGVKNGKVTLSAPQTADTYTYTITATDKDDLKGMVTLKVTVEGEFVSQIAEKTSQALGAQTAAAPGYYSVADGPISSSNFDANKDKVNFSYGITDKAGSESAAASKLISISDRSSEGLTKNTTGGITTYFAASDLDYANVTDAQINAISKSSTSTIQIEAGKTYEFVSGDYKGLIKVVSITDGTDTSKGEATISVKSIKQ